MKIDFLFNKKIAVITIGFTIGGLLLLLLRENEGRLSAEEKLKDYQYRATWMKSQKDDAILDLQSQVSALQAKLQEAADSQTALVTQNKAQMNALNLQMQDSSSKYESALKEKDENIGKLDSKSKEEAVKFSDLLKEKNTEINDLGKRLESASKKLAALNKKIAKLETKDLDCENKLDEAQTSLDKAKKQSVQLSETLEANKKQQAVLD